MASRIILFIALVVLLPGCHRAHNEGISPGTTPLSIYAEPAEAGDAELRHDGPSLQSGHDRSAWRPLVVNVPVNQVESHTIAEASPHYLQRTPRERGEFPAADDAVAVTPNSCDHLTDASLEGLGTIGAMVLAPIRFFESFSVYNVRRSPDGDYERLPARHVNDLERWYAPSAGQP